MGLIEFKNELEDLIAKAQKSTIPAQDIKDALESAMDDIEEEDDEEEESEDG